MARNVNVMLSNFRTGTKVAIARRLVDVTVNYIDANDQPQTRSGTVTFPDILSQLSADDLKEFALDIMLSCYPDQEWWRTWEFITGAGNSRTARAMARKGYLIEDVSGYRYKLNSGIGVTQ